MLSAGQDLGAAQLLLGVGSGGHRLQAGQHGADHHRRAGRLFGRDPHLHHVRRHESLVHLGHPRPFWRRGCGGGGDHPPAKIGSTDDAAFILKNAATVIIVPGYGMAVAQAQHALREMADKLKAEASR